MTHEQASSTDPSRGLPPTPPSEPRETLKSSPEIGIFDENDRLTRAVLWGSVGAEAVLAQIYPKDISLFYDQMDVVGARQESEKFVKELEAQGIEVNLARDILATEILARDLEKKAGVRNVSRNGLINELVIRGQGVYQEYYYGDGREKHTGDFPRDNSGAPVIKDLSSYASSIASLVDSDIERYGLELAILLNEFISIDHRPPLGNSIYARDQMNVILGTRFISAMKEPIRKREVPVYEDVYEWLGISEGVDMPLGETFEGGDAYVHNGVVYVGVGARTSEGAADHIYRTLKQNGQLDQSGFRLVMVKDMHMGRKTPEERQQFMHLDTFSNPIDSQTVVVCETEVDNRHAIELTLDDKGRLVKTDLGRFVRFLRDEGQNVIQVKPEAQKEFACNFLAIDGQTIFMADTNDEANESVSKMLEEIGKTVVRIPLRESTRGYGASHCMTGQLKRE